MNMILIENLESLLGANIRIINENNFTPILNIKPILEADKDSLVFIDINSKNKLSLISQTKAKVIICDFIPENDKLYFDKCLIITNNPKLTFALTVNSFTQNTLNTGIHPTSVIHPEATISKSCIIGPYCIIGKCVIGNDTILNGNCVIYDGVRIGDNVIIDSGVVIGASGFGFVRKNDGTPVPFPQLGGVIIGDFVEIGANTCIDRGALQDTIIGDHTKIDNLVQISHNVNIGKNTYIIGHCLIAGSVKIGKNCWIAASRVMNKVIIGNNVTIGFGALVLNNVKSDTTQMGVPSMGVEQYSNLQYKLKKIIKS